MTNQEILDNTPDGATHYVLDNGTSYSFKISGFQTAIWSGEWIHYADSKKSLPDLDNIRSLADIKRIVELEEQLLNKASEVK